MRGSRGFQLGHVAFLPGFRCSYRCFDYVSLCAHKHAMSGHWKRPLSATSWSPVCVDFFLCRRLFETIIKQLSFSKWTLLLLTALCFHVRRVLFIIDSPYVTESTAANVSIESNVLQVQLFVLSFCLLDTQIQNVRIRNSPNTVKQVRVVKVSLDSLSGSIRSLNYRSFNVLLCLGLLYLTWPEERWNERKGYYAISD